MAKIITSVSLESEVKTHIDNNPEIISFSHWAQNRYIDEFMKLDSKTKELGITVKKLERLKTQIKKIKEETKSLKSRLSKEALLWLRTEGKRRSLKYSEEGVYKFFINKYGLETQVNRRQFKILMDQT